MISPRAFRDPAHYITLQCFLSFRSVWVIKVWYVCINNKRIMLHLHIGPRERETEREGKRVRVRDRYECDLHTIYAPHLCFFTLSLSLFRIKRNPPRKSHSINECLVAHCPLLLARSFSSFSLCIKFALYIRGGVNIFLPCMHTRSPFLLLSSPCIRTVQQRELVFQWAND